MGIRKRVRGRRETEREGEGGRRQLNDRTGDTEIEIERYGNGNR